MLNKIFVYGTLKAGLALDRPSLKKLRTKVEPATLPFGLYKIQWFPTINTNDPKHITNGEIHTYETESMKEVLSIIDEIEGFDPPFSEHSLFLRKTMTAIVNKKPTKVFVYEYNHKISLNNLIESGIWKGV